MMTLSGGRIGIAAQALGIASGEHGFGVGLLERAKSVWQNIGSIKLFNSNWPIWQQRLKLQEKC